MTQNRPTGEPAPRRVVARREWQDALKAGSHGLKPGWVSAAMALLMWMDQDGTCFPGQETLAAAMGKSSRAVRDDLEWLEHVGWVNIRRGGRRGDRAVSSRYQSALPSGTQVPDGEVSQTCWESDDLGSSSTPNRNPGTSQPEPGDAPTGTTVPTNSQRTPRGNSQETTTAPGGFPGDGSPGAGAASRQAAADADGRTQEQVNADGLRAARQALNTRPAAQPTT